MGNFSKISRACGRFRDLEISRFQKGIFSGLLTRAESWFFKKFLEVSKNLFLGQLKKCLVKFLRILTRQKTYNYPQFFFEGSILFYIFLIFLVLKNYFIFNIYLKIIYEILLKLCQLSWRTIAFVDGVEYLDYRASLPNAIHRHTPPPRNRIWIFDDSNRLWCSPWHTCRLCFGLEKDKRKNLKI